MAGPNSPSAGPDRDAIIQVAADWRALEQADRHESLAAHHRQQAELAAARLAQAGIEGRAITLEGDPAAEILRLAHEEDTDLLVLGSRGHTGLSRIVLGSVARSILLHARASVLVAHP